MTTIAYDHSGGEIAYDSRITQNAHICSDTHNKRVENQHGVWFFTGNEAHKDMFIKKAYMEGIDGLAFLVKPGGQVVLVYPNRDNKRIEETPLSYDDAIGSGCDHAITALDLGCSARHAVRMAIRRDSKSGGKVRSYRIKR